VSIEENSGNTGIYCASDGEITIGRSEACTIVCKNCVELSSVHVIIKSSEMNRNMNQKIAIMTGRNGGYVNGNFIKRGEDVALSYADVIELFGLYLIWLGEYVAVSTEQLNISCILRCAKKVSLNNNMINVQEEPFFSKAPRSYFAYTRDDIELDAPPEKREDERPPILMTMLPALTMSLPMIMGFLVSRAAAKNTGAVSSTFMYTGLVTAICSALLGVIWALTNYRNRSRQTAINEEKRKRAYIEYVNDSETIIKEHYNRNVSNLYLMYPDVSEYFKKVNDIVLGYDKYLLWNRKRTDEDFLCVRIGTGNIPYDLSINIPKDRFSVVEDELRKLPKKLKERYSHLRNVPIVVNLEKNICTGVICDGYRSDELFLLIVCSLAVSVSPEDVSFVFDFRSGIINENTIRALRFLPHLYRRNNNHNLLNCEINANDREMKETKYILFTDVAEASMSLANDTGIRNDFAKTELTDLTARIVFADDFRKLPFECRFIIQKSNSFGGCVSLAKNNNYRQNVHFDTVRIEDAEKYAREMCSVKIRKSKEVFKLPDSISFFELFGLTISAEFIEEEWNLNSTSDNIKVPIGIGENGEILELDFHEKGAGPHGLIAGMTGSGKSEILQTIILSLAVKFCPEDIGFFLIDYKGGGMSELFEGLPHILGSISNLSGRMIYRAMVSIKSENEKRQRIFSEYSVNNISSYQELYRLGRSRIPLPHIFIIVDEFAELKKEEPDFMRELISIARVGRSLGIHLILATQKPAGTVDDNILSNSRFRICLKVQDRMDSMETLGRPDAASISRPGQAYLQIGNNEVFMKFQGAYTMDKSYAPTRKEILILKEISGRQIQRKEDHSSIYDGSLTQLKRSVIAIQTASNYTKLCGADCIKEKIGSLWLPPLPDYIVYSCKEEGREEKEGGKVEKAYQENKVTSIKMFNVPVGIYDNPSKQMQGELIINIVRTGNQIILGSLQCGKSSLLQILAAVMQRNLPPYLLNMYFIDFSHERLIPFKSLLHTGIYINDENEEDIEKLFFMLERAISKRKELLRGGNFRQYIESNNSLPAMIVFIDGIGALRERTKYAYDKNLEYILKNGESLGIYIVATALNISSTEIPRRLFECFKSCIPIQLRDRYEYRDVLSVNNDLVFMPENVKGRGLYNTGEEIVEFQAFLPADGENDFERSSELISILNKRNSELKAQYGEEEIKESLMKVPVIPRNNTVTEFIREVRLRAGSEEFDLNSYLPIGYHENSGMLFGIPLNKEITVVISGRSGSGKKNLCKVISAMISEFAIDESASFSLVIYDENLPYSELMDIKNSIGNDPYVIHLGGGVDRQNIADFSYIPYSKQSELKKPGRGIVRKTLAGYDYGEIRIPEYDLC